MYQSCYGFYPTHIPWDVFVNFVKNHKKEYNAACAKMQTNGIDIMLHVEQLLTNIINETEQTETFVCHATYPSGRIVILFNPNLHQYIPEQITMICTTYADMLKIRQEDRIESYAVKTIK